MDLEHIHCDGPKRSIRMSTNHSTIRYHVHFCYSECLKWFSLLKQVYYSNTQISHFWYSVSKFLVICTASILILLRVFEGSTVVMHVSIMLIISSTLCMT